MDIVIRSPKLTDLKSWHKLWESYLRFYQAKNFDHEITELLWQRIHTVEHPINCFVAQDSKSNQLVGLVHFFPHVDTWQKFPVCYLEDLYVNCEQRGKGLGRSLIAAVESKARDSGWHSVYWQTKQDNEAARLLYDKLTGGTSGFVTYRLPLT